MAKVHLTQSSFTAGELSPRVLGRTDLDRYQTGLKRCRNAHPVIQGGVKRRAGTRYTAAALTTTAGGSVLVPFVAGRGAAWFVEFGNLTARVFNIDGTLAGVTLTTPYTTAQLASLDWAQSDTTLYLFHPSHPIQRLQLLGGTTWVLSPAPFTQVPFAEVGIVGPAILSLSASTVGTGRTFTASNPSFREADVGRAIIAGPGIGVITAYSSTTIVTVEITRAFASTTIPAAEWVLEGSPQATCTPSAKDPVGASITLTLSLQGWRSTDVGSLVRINGGLVRITTYTSETVVSAVILRELSGTTAAPALAWTLEAPVWSAAWGYPRTGTIYQQRLIAAGTSRFPRTVWGSRIGEPLDFELWTNDSDGFAFTIDADDAAPIAWVSASSDLMVLTEAGEFSMRGGVEKPITPTNVRVEPESNHGAAAVRPVTINRETVFVQRAGRKVRSLGYRYDFDGYSAPDVAALAEHLTVGGIVSMCYQQEPEQLIWAARADGSLLSCTFDRDQNPSVVGWALHTLGGVVECVAAAPATDRDVVWMIVRRTISGSTVRFIERFDETFVPIHPTEQTADSPTFGAVVDCAVVIDNGTGTTAGVAAHLPNTVVDIVADGARQPRVTLNGSGGTTLPRLSKRIMIGLPFTSEAQLLTPEFGTDTGSAQGQQARTGEVTLRFIDTIGGKVRNVHGEQSDLPTRQFGPAVLNQPPQVFSGLVSLSVLGWKRSEAEVTVIQDEPFPLHLLSVTRRHTVNGG